MIPNNGLTLVIVGIQMIIQNWRWTLQDLQRVDFHRSCTSGKSIFYYLESQPMRCVWIPANSIGHISLPLLDLKVGAVLRRNLHHNNRREIQRCCRAVYPVANFERVCKRLSMILKQFTTMLEKIKLTPQPYRKKICSFYGAIKQIGHPGVQSFILTEIVFFFEAFFDIKDRNICYGF